MNYWNSIQPDHTFQDRTVIMRIQHCLRYLKDPEKIVNLRNLWPFVLSLRTIYERPSDNASYLLFLAADRLVSASCRMIYVFESRGYDVNQDCQGSVFQGSS